MKEKVYKYDSSRFNELLQELQQLRLEPFDEDKLIRLFNKYGIYLAIENAFTGTKIRGCTSVKISSPAIYMTKLYKDKASFYFALYHELGHVKSDYNMAKSKNIIDLIDDIEQRADNFVLNAMVPSYVWNKIVVDLKNLEKICGENNIPICFATSRLVREGIISYNSLIYNKYKEQI